MATSYSVYHILNPSLFIIYNNFNSFYYKDNTFENFPVIPNSSDNLQDKVLYSISPMHGHFLNLECKIYRIL